jgi:hypothetical protein
MGGGRTELLEIPTHARAHLSRCSGSTRCKPSTMAAAVECGRDAIQTSKSAGAHNAGKFDFFDRQLFK